MGVQVGTETVTLEKRLGNVLIYKDLDKNSAYAEVEWVLGYRDSQGNWHTTKKDVIKLNLGELLFLMKLKESDLGLDPSQDVELGVIFNTALYALITNQISLTSTATFHVQDSSGNPVDAFIEIYDMEGKFVDSAVPDEALEIPVLVSPKIIVTAPGFKPFEKTYDVIAGQLEDTFILEPSNSSAAG